jgi:hypothetical protein
VTDDHGIELKIVPARLVSSVRDERWKEMIRNG